MTEQEKARIALALFKAAGQQARREADLGNPFRALEILLELQDTFLTLPKTQLVQLLLIAVTDQ